MHEITRCRGLTPGIFWKSDEHDNRCGHQHVIETANCPALLKTDSEDEMGPLVSDASTFTSSVLRDFFSWGRLALWPCNGEEGGQQTATGIKSIAPLRMSRRQTIYNRGYYCLSHDIKASTVGEEKLEAHLWRVHTAWKSPHWELSHGAFCRAP